MASTVDENARFVAAISELQDRHRERLGRLKQTYPENQQVQLYVLDSGKQLRDVESKYSQEFSEVTSEAPRKFFIFYDNDKVRAFHRRYILQFEAIFREGVDVEQAAKKEAREQRLLGDPTLAAVASSSTGTVPLASPAWPQQSHREDPPATKLSETAAPAEKGKQDAPSPPQGDA